MLPLPAQIKLHTLPNGIKAMSNYAKTPRIPRPYHVPDKRIVIIKDIQAIVKFKGEIMTQPEVRRTIEIMLGVISEALRRGEKVRITGVGTFYTKKTSPTKYSYYLNGYIPVRTVVKFRPSQQILEYLNSEEPKNAG